MNTKIYKPVLCALALLLTVSVGFAQSSTAKKKQSASVNVSFDSKDFEAKMNDFAKKLEVDLNDMGKNLTASLSNLSVNVDGGNVSVNSNSDVDSKVNLNLNLNLGNLLNDLDVNIAENDNNNDNNSDDVGVSSQSQKVKSFTKSYPLDGNDRIKLSSQYGKITVNTWNNHEIKVEVQIKAEADNDDDAQKILDGVQIIDSKSDDEVSFRTRIDNGDNGWSISKLLGRNKKHKLTINYTVYMPAKNDLNIEESYGSIVLPNLDGRVRVSSSYGSTTIQNLSNPSNNIEGSYGSMKIGTMNGGKLDFSYGSVEMDECSNIKADLSYGSFKLGKLRESGEFDMSYEGGFRIGELAGTLRRLNISNSYSGVTLGVTPASNFDFDITTSYGGFNYNDNNVFITAKNPPDGSKHIGSTRSYKGHVGKAGSDARVTINGSYGGVKFE